MNRWVFPFLAAAVLAFALFPSPVVSLLGGRADVSAGPGETLIELEVPGVT